MYLPNSHLFFICFSNYSLSPLLPQLPVLPSLHLAVYPSLHPDLVSPCNPTSWTFSLSPTGSLYTSTPPTSHPHPPALCSHCSVSNGSAPSQQIHQVEAGRASAPANASQRLALSRSTVYRSYRWQMAHIHTSAHAEGYRLGYRKIYVQWHKHLPAKQMHRHAGVLIGVQTQNANKCSCNHILTQAHKRHSKKRGCMQNAADAQMPRNAVSHVGHRKKAVNVQMQGHPTHPRKKENWIYRYWQWAAEQVGAATERRADSKETRNPVYYRGRRTLHEEPNPCEERKKGEGRGRGWKGEEQVLSDQQDRNKSNEQVDIKGD